MIELGKIQTLEVIRTTSIGVYLNSQSDKNDEDILLPQKQVPKNIAIGDTIEVFVYRDSEDRIIATTKKPKIILGELETLKVIEITRIGAFLDWGLPKDLFLPFKEQTNQIQKGRKYLVGLYVDKSDRLCATMDIYSLLSNQSPYKEGDRVEGTIYRLKKDMGALVAVDNKYYGLIPNQELYTDYKCGDTLSARVIKVREDGKIDLSVREKAYMQMDEDAQAILDKINHNGGIIYLGDRSNPDEIKAEMKMSKRAFKRAIGRLLKEEKINITEDGIELR